MRTYATHMHTERDIRFLHSCITASRKTRYRTCFFFFHSGRPGAIYRSLPSMGLGLDAQYQSLHVACSVDVYMLSCPRQNQVKTMLTSVTPFESAENGVGFKEGSFGLRDG